MSRAITYVQNVSAEEEIIRIQDAVQLGRQIGVLTKGELAVDWRHFWQGVDETADDYSVVGAMAKFLKGLHSFLPNAVVHGIIIAGVVAVIAAAAAVGFSIINLFWPAPGASKKEKSETSSPDYDGFDLRAGAEMALSLLPRWLEVPLQLFLRRLNLPGGSSSSSSAPAKESGPTLGSIATNIIKSTPVGAAGFGIGEKIGGIVNTVSKGIDLFEKIGGLFPGDAEFDGLDGNEYMAKAMSYVPEAPEGVDRRLWRRKAAEAFAQQARAAGKNV